MSTWPFWMNASRLADTVSTNSTPSSGMPSLAATSLPISTSKPSGCWAGFSSPKPGWSNFVPMVMVPASLRAAMVVPGSKVASVSTATVFSAACSAWSPASLEQPASTAPAVMTAVRVAKWRMVRMGSSRFLWWVSG